jgi:hypothetical protein
MQPHTRRERKWLQLFHVLNDLTCTSEVVSDEVCTTLLERGGNLTIESEMCIVVMMCVICYWCDDCWCYVVICLVAVGHVVIVGRIVYVGHVGFV